MSPVGMNEEVGIKAGRERKHGAQRNAGRERDPGEFMSALAVVISPEPIIIWTRVDNRSEICQ